MKKKGLKISRSGDIAWGLSGAAQATLIDRGNGLIYDSGQDLTWLQDANYAKTSGHDADGRMNWDAATTWADGLSYGGYDDWRLPSVTDIGNDGCNFSYNGSDCGFDVDTSGSELAYMWYDILGNTPYYDTSGSGQQVGLGLTSTAADGVDILNLQSYRYWSGTEYAPNTNFAWLFDASVGSQTAAIRAKDMSSMPGLFAPAMSPLPRCLSPVRYYCRRRIGGCCRRQAATLLIGSFEHFGSF